MVLMGWGTFTSADTWYLLFQPQLPDGRHHPAEVPYVYETFAFVYFGNKVKRIIGVRIANRFEWGKLFQSLSDLPVNGKGDGRIVHMADTSRSA